jgi:thymidylate synthase (FAD)
MDKLFRVEVIEATPNPQQVIRVAMGQDYSEDFIYDFFGMGRNPTQMPSEKMCGEVIVKNLLKGGRGHYGPLEHPSITFNVGWFPHSTMQQMRTHRVGVSFDVQSFRYTGSRIIDVVNGKREVEEVFYLRPLGLYTDRQGKKYEYNAEQRQQDIGWCLEASRRYKQKIEMDFSEEHARGLIPFDVRQHWVMSANVRSLMHLLDLRWKADAQLECQQLCDLIWPHFREWVPEISEWYEENRAKKARLAP